jgi:non-specific serine/threonine protein kinase
MDPAEPLWDLWLAWMLAYDGRLDELATMFEGTHQEPSGPHRRWGIAWARAWLGQRQQALALLEAVNASGPFDSYTQQCILLREALRGNRDAFDRALIPELTESARLDGQLASTLAEYCGLFGDLDGALVWLEHAVSRGWINYPLYAWTDPFLESLRGTARFAAFLERVKEQWEHFET